MAVCRADRFGHPPPQEQRFLVSATHPAVAATHDCSAPNLCSGDIVYADDLRRTWHDPDWMKQTLALGEAAGVGWTIARRHAERASRRRVGRWRKGSGWRAAWRVRPVPDRHDPYPSRPTSRSFPSPPAGATRPSRGHCSGAAPAASSSPSRRPASRRQIRAGWDWLDRLGLDAAHGQPETA